MWINPCIIWHNFIHEFGPISCLFIVKIIVMPWNTRQVTDPSLQRWHINVADMHVFTKSCVWIKTEHFFLMVSMDLELLWICSCWMFCSPSFVLAFRAIRCHDKFPWHIYFLASNITCVFCRKKPGVHQAGWSCESGRLMVLLLADPSSFSFCSSFIKPLDQGYFPMCC